MTTTSVACGCLQKLQQARTDTQKLLNTVIGLLYVSLIGIVVVLVYGTYVHWLVGLMYFLMIPTIGISTFFITKRIETAQTPIVQET